MLFRSAGVTATAALDVMVGPAAVTSLKLGFYIGQPTTVTIPFTTFAPLTFMSTGSMGINFTYRIRNVQPAQDCVSLDINLSPSNELTLYGAP